MSCIMVASYPSSLRKRDQEEQRGREAVFVTVISLRSLLHV